VEAAGVVAHELALGVERDVELGHVLERLPGILGVVVRIVRRPDGHVLERVPHAIHHGFVGLEPDGAPPAEGLGGAAAGPAPRRARGSEAATTRWTRARRP